MPALAFSIDTPAGTFDSFEESSAAGYPIACAWFARCPNEAVVAISHPVLDAVPCCQSCADFAEGK